MYWKMYWNVLEFRTSDTMATLLKFLLVGGAGKFLFWDFLDNISIFFNSNNNLKNSNNNSNPVVPRGLYGPEKSGKFYDFQLFLEKSGKVWKIDDFPFFCLEKSGKLSCPH